MVNVGRVWDRTTQVLAGRGHALAGIAVVATFLPSVLRGVYTAYVPTTPGHALLGGLIGLVAALLTVWAGLALIALSSDPGTTRAHAVRLATRRLLPFLGIAILVGIGFGIVAVPMFVALGGALNPAAIAALQLGIVPAVAPGAVLFAALYGLVLFVVAVWLSARLILLTPVVVNERLGLRSLRRAFDLTRGSTWKIVGVLVLYAVILAVAAGAAYLVAGLVARLVLGGGAIATVGVIASIAVTAVTTALSVVAAAFKAQLYVAAANDAPLP